MSKIHQVRLLCIVSNIFLFLAFPHLSLSKELWLKCPQQEGYLIRLNEKTKTYMLNDWFFINQDGILRIGGDWFYGNASFNQHQIEIVFMPTSSQKNKRYTWRKRFLISRIDLGYQEFDAKKINDDNWSGESASFNTNGICIFTKDPGIRNKF